MSSKLLVPVLTEHGYGHSYDIGYGLLGHASHLDGGQLLSQLLLDLTDNYPIDHLYTFTTDGSSVLKKCTCNHSPLNFSTMNAIHKPPQLLHWIASPCICYLVYPLFLISKHCLQHTTFKLLLQWCLNVSIVWNHLDFICILIPGSLSRRDSNGTQLGCGLEIIFYASMFENHCSTKYKKVIFCKLMIFTSTFLRKEIEDSQRQ